MTGTLAHLIDPGALAIVLIGTALASAARCGRADCAAALRAAGALVRRRFDEAANRKALAVVLHTIAHDGRRAADPPLPPDADLALMVDAYLRRGAIVALDQVWRAQRARSETARAAAVRAFACGGELAPVFGLVGTLYGLTGLVPAAGADAATTIMAAVSSAVLTSLYGVLVAHFVCLPLAGAIERGSLAEEEAREALREWFAARLAEVSPSGALHPHIRGVA